MNQEVSQHLLSYIVLVVGLVSATFVFLIVWPDRYWLHLISLALGLFYLGWGLNVHWRSGLHSPKIFWEYAAVAAVGVTLLWLLSW